ncbi:MAG: hypothetical protein OXG08_08660 [Gammaproteobacteria bacterium]|nr:hypothetical protein [Gammaproteobacteria bacterium]
MYAALQALLLRLAFVSVVALPVFAQSDEGNSEPTTITIGTWNLSNLASQDEGVQPRSFDDLRILASYARRLGADVIAVQEVSDERVLNSVFGENYVFHLSNRSSELKTGFAIRKEVQFTPLPDFADLATSPGLRHGTQIELNLSGQTLRLMSVHLQSGCLDEKSEDSADNEHDCEKLAEQVPFLSKWFEQTTSQTDHVVILGDFGRHLADRGGDWILDELNQIAPIKSAMTGFEPLCWRNKQSQYTAHFLLTKPVQDSVVSDSFREVTFAASHKRIATDEQGRELLYPSDHCPITVELEY